MTVRELIEKLERVEDQGLPVFVWGAWWMYEADTVEPTPVDFEHRGVVVR